MIRFNFINNLTVIIVIKYVVSSFRLLCVTAVKLLDSSICASHIVWKAVSTILFLNYHWICFPFKFPLVLFDFLIQCFFCLVSSLLSFIQCIILAVIDYLDLYSPVYYMKWCIFWHAWMFLPTGDQRFTCRFDFSFPIIRFLYCISAPIYN